MPITDDVRKRAEAINELIHTEQRYLQRLQVLKSIFEVPSEMVISPEERRVLFQNLDDLVSTSTTMLDRLSQSQLENCDCVGSKFLESVAELEVLKIYCINHSKANKLLHELMKGNKKFARLVKEASESPECESLQLVSFLLEPVQRLTRYPLLLRQILHYTPKDHPDHNFITEGLHKSEMILRDTNEAVRALENMEKLEEIQAKLLKGTGRFPMGLSSIFGSSRLSSASGDKIGFDLTGQSIEGGQRWFCHSGNGSVSRKDIEIVLFNDIMLIVRPHMGTAFELVGQPFEVQLIETIKQEITFIGNGFTPLTVKFEDEDETETWLHEVRQAQKKLRASKSKIFIKPALVHFIGSMELTVLDFTRPKAKKAAPVACMFKLGFYEATSEETKTGTVSERIIIPIAHYHEDLEITLVQIVKLSPKIHVAICRLPLDFLEYYQNKETDEMDLSMNCPKTGNHSGSVKLKIFYKVF